MRRAGPMGRPFAFMALPTMTASRGQQRAACGRAGSARSRLRRTLTCACAGYGDAKVGHRDALGTSARTHGELTKSPGSVPGLFTFRVPTMTVSRGQQHAACGRARRTEPAEAEH